MMLQFQNTYMPQQTNPVMDWSKEITLPQTRPMPPSDTGIGGVMGGNYGNWMQSGMPQSGMRDPEMMNGGMADSDMSNNGMSNSGMWNNGNMAGSMDTTISGSDMAAEGMPGLDMRTGLPDEVIQAPTSISETYRGSLKAMLARNVGNYVVATFLIGTQGTVSWEGILYDVGNDFVTIYQTGRDRYIVTDIYSLKYIEFYDVERRQRCEQILRNLEQQNG